MHKKNCNNIKAGKIGPYVAMLAFFLLSACTLTQRQDAALAEKSNGSESIAEQITRLQRAVDETKALVNKSTEQSPDISKRLADLGNRIEEVDANLRSYVGRLDAMEKMSNQAAPQPADSPRIKKLEGDLAALAKRIESFESNSNEKAAPAATTIAAPSPAKPKEITQEPKASKARSAQDLYDEAYTSYKKGKHEASRKLFSEYISQYPNSDLADNAYFWIGESFYDQGKYEEAILRYDNIVQKFKESEKVPSALLKQAYAFRAINDSYSAKTLLNKLIKEHRNSEQATIAQKVLDLISP